VPASPPPLEDPRSAVSGRASNGRDGVGDASGAATDRNVELVVPIPSVDLALIGQ